MKAMGPKHERETIINYNEDKATATIWTASQPVYRRLLKRLGQSCLTEDSERHAIFTFPLKWLILPRQKAKRVSDPTRMAKLRGNIARTPIPEGENDQKGPILKQ